MKIDNGSVGIQYRSLALNGETVSYKGKAGLIIALAVHLS